MEVLEKYGVMLTLGRALKSVSSSFTFLQCVSETLISEKHKESLSESL